MKQVRETAAGKSISAWVVLKDGKQVAQVQAHFGQSRVQVDIWATPDWSIQQGSASGHGYDKLTAAMAGMTIDGIRITNHCETDATIKALLAEYHNGNTSEKAFRDALREFGASPANWSNVNGRWEDAYYDSGLDRLKALGYQVIQAI